MKKLNIKKLLRESKIVTLIICAIVFLILITFSLLLKGRNDTYVSVFSLAFTSLGALATVATLVVAIELYDRFGLRGHFVHRQTEVVLELVDALKGKSFHFDMHPIEVIVRPSRQQLSVLSQIPTFSLHASKSVLIAFDEFQTATKQLIEISRNYWLPDEIKKKMHFFEIHGAIRLADDENIENNIKMTCSNSPKQRTAYMHPIPNFTTAQFCENMRLLSLAIEAWLFEHSKIKLDYRFEEPIAESKVK